MDPVQGSVEWSTWGSKLESIFQPVFATIPNLMGCHVTCPLDTGMEVPLAYGLTKATLAKVRDSLSYAVLVQPLHGDLDDLVTASDYVTYTPHNGFIGTDFFTYRMQIGRLVKQP